MPIGPAASSPQIYTSGTTITIPSGALGAFISAIGAGGAGLRAGGGGGGCAEKTYTILEAEWDTNLTVAIGAGAASTNGGNTTVDGTMNGSAITQLKGFGGVKGGSGTGGSGGTASGGSTNNDGEIGSDYEAEGPTYGVGGHAGICNQIETQTSYTNGSGGGGQVSGSVAGLQGMILITWFY
jgi:hypothetical protein